MKRVTLCMIVRDEEDNLGVCLRSIRDHVDEIVIVDTGSTDNTKAVATQFGANVFQFDPQSHPQHFYKDDEENGKLIGCPGPYSGEMALANFAAARNESFRHATGDYVFWVDADDEVEHPEALRGAIDIMERENVQTGFLPYNYASDSLGRVFYRQWRERIFKRGIGEWSQPVHEVYMPHNPTPPSRFEFPLIKHRRKDTRKTVPNRNYKILLRQLKQTTDAGQKPDPRTLFYAGQEARFIEPVKAVAFYNEYLSQSGWPEERAAAHVALGTMMEFGVINIPRDQALQHANREYATAAAETPGNPDGLFGLARVAYLRGRHSDCIRFSEQAFAIGNTESMLGANPMDRLYRPHVYYNHSLSHVGRIEDAIESCKKGLEVCPDDPGVPGGAPGMLKNNLAVYLRELEDRKKKAAPPMEGRPALMLDKSEDLASPPANVPTDVKVIWSVQLWKHHMAQAATDKAMALLELVPDDVKRDTVWLKMREMTKASAPDSAKDIVFYVGPGFEHWTPDSPNITGLGGSETAVIEMAKQLQALGRKVTVYAEASGTWDGVEYLHHSEFHGTNCKVFIASRTPWAIHHFGKVVADISLLWVHDIHCGPRTPELEWALWQFDRVLCLSQWHREYFLSIYPTLDASRVVVTRNGIVPERFAVLPEKTNRMVWSSSPNRGLLRLLGFMREIRKKVPDAAVDIYYGFDCWETMMKLHNNQQQLQEIAMYKDQIAQAEAEGIAKFHGRRPQPELAQAFLRSKVWAYPTDFPETSCISAMEAQAAGCLVVATRFAALGETVKEGILIDPKNMTSGDFVQNVVAGLLGDGAHTARRARDYAMENLSWKKNAEDWVKLFDQLKEAIKENPIHPWREAA